MKWVWSFIVPSLEVKLQVCLHRNNIVHIASVLSSASRLHGGRDGSWVRSKHGALCLHRFQEVLNEDDHETLRTHLIRHSKQSHYRANPVVIRGHYVTLMGIEADTGDRLPLGLAARELPWARL